MPISRYKNCPNIDGRFYGTINFPSKKDLDNITVYQVYVTKFDRLDVLANKYFGDFSLWWVLAIMNDIDWMFALEDGQVLKVPVNVDDVLRLM